MAIGEDRVQVAKTESTALGGKDSDADIYGAPIPLNPEEDAIESAGGYVQESGTRDENVGWHRDGNNLRLFDNATGNSYPGHTLTTLLTGFDVDSILTSADGSVLVNQYGNVLISG